MWTSSQVEEVDKDMSAIKEEEEEKDMIISSFKRKDPPSEEEEEEEEPKNNDKKQQHHLEDHYCCYDFDKWKKEEEEEEKKHFEDEEAHYYEYDEDEEHDGIWYPVPPFSSHLPEEEKKRLRRSLRDDMRELTKNPPVGRYDPFKDMKDTEFMTVEQAKSLYNYAMDPFNGLDIDLDQGNSFIHSFIP